MFRVTLLIEDVALLYLKHADAYYRKDGEPTGEIVNVKIALRFAIALHRRTRCREFGPKALNEVMNSMIVGGLCRQSILGGGGTDDSYGTRHVSVL